MAVNVDKKSMEGAVTYWKLHMKRELSAALRQAGTGSRDLPMDVMTETEMSEAVFQSAPASGGRIGALLDIMPDPKNVVTPLAAAAAVAALVLLLLLVLLCAYLWYSSSAWKTVALELASDVRHKSAETRVRQLEEMLAAIKQSL
jgi:hypothetical protein